MWSLILLNFDQNYDYISHISHLEISLIFFRLALYRFAEFRIGSVKPISKTPDTETLVELEVMKVVQTRRRKTGQLVAAVIAQCSEWGPSQPEPIGK